MTFEETLKATLKDALREVLREERLTAAAPAPANASSSPLAVSVGEAACRLGGVHPTTVRKWIKSGALPAARTPGGRDFLVRIADLDAFLLRQTPTSSQPPEHVIESRVARIVASLPGRK